MATVKEKDVWKGFKASIIRAQPTWWCKIRARLYLLRYRIRGESNTKGTEYTVWIERRF